MIPVWLIRALVVGTILAAIAWAHHLGESRAEERHAAQLATMRADHSAALAEAERAHREIERQAAEDMNDAASRLREAETNAQNEIAGLRADLRSARVRLSVPVASCTADAGAGADPGAAARAGAEARAELMPQTADDLIAIGADGDAAVRQLNAVIDAYNALRARVNQAD